MRIQTQPVRLWMNVHLGTEKHPSGLAFLVLVRVRPHRHLNFASPVGGIPIHGQIHEYKEPPEMLRISGGFAAWISCNRYRSSPDRMLHGSHCT